MTESCVSQIYFAKKGELTPQMREVAQSERMDVRALCDLIAQGRAIIPANVNHKSLKPIGIGHALRCKINANIGSSGTTSDIEGELEKLEVCLKYGADTVMDLSTGGDLDEIRAAIIERSPVPIGTVPIYQMIHELGDIKNLKTSAILSTIEKQARQGVDYFTIHAGFKLEFMPLLSRRKMGIVSRGGSLIASWMMKFHKQNPFYEAFDEICDICAAYDVALSLGDGLRPGCLYDATDRAQLSELEILGELALRANEKNVQVMIEGPGHIPFNEIELNIQLERKLCRDAPFYVLGPLPTDIGAGYDHISSAIGGTMAAYCGASMLCYVTPKEHLGLPNAKDVRKGIIAHKIAAHAADVALGKAGAIERDHEMSDARYNFDWNRQFELSFDPAHARELHDESLGDEIYKGAEFCSMCGPKFCAYKISRNLTENKEKE